MLPEPEAVENVLEEAPKVEAQPTLEKVGKPVLEKELLSDAPNPTTADLPKEGFDQKDAPKGIDEKRD